MFATTEAVSVKYRWLLLDPIFLADMLTVTMGWVILGFNEPTLEPSLRDVWQKRNPKVPVPANSAHMLFSVCFSSTLPTRKLDPFSQFNMPPTRLAVLSQGSFAILT